MAPPWVELLDETIGVCAAHRRSDLAHRLRQERARLLDPALRVLVIGEPNQGKSQLVNALVNAPVCAVGDDLTTAVTTVVQHADIPSAALVTEPVPPSPRALPRPAAAAPAPPTPPAPERVPLPLEQVTRRIGGKKVAQHDGQVIRAEIGVPRKLLAGGLVLIDTPAVGWPGQPRATGLPPALEQADAILLASDATEELSAAELDLLGRVARRCPTVIVAVTKIDLAPRWREITERNRFRLARAGVPARLVAVSATLRLAALRTGDRGLNTESGFPALITCLQQHVAGKATQLAPRAVAVLTSNAIAELAVPLREQLSPGELAGPHAPAGAGGAVASVSDAQQRLDQLRRDAARWQTTLADAMTDLAADVEYDLRERTRQILRQVDQAFDDADPTTAWPAFEDWLATNLTEAGAANADWLVQRCRWIAAEIARQIPGQVGCGVPESLLDFAEDPLAEPLDVTPPRLESFSASQKIFTGLRGSYGGVLMFGLITSMAGLPLINPISLSAGAAFGGKSIRDESVARLRRRQAAAKAAAQRHVDDFFLRLSKAGKDFTRQAHRLLRDHVAECAQQLQDDLTAAIRSAGQAAAVDAAERDRRSHGARGELERLVTLHHRVQALVTARAEVARPAGLEITA